MNERVDSGPEVVDAADVAVAEYMRRVDAGASVDRESFLAEYPQFANELREYFDSADAVERMAGPPIAASTARGVGKSVETHATGIGDSVSEKPAGAASGKAERVSPVEEDDPLPEHFGRYRIEKRLGSGAMGSVYLAHDTQLDRHVALKTPSFDAQTDAELVERFYSEARSAANLRHAGICPVYDVDEIDGVHYISMAFIDGKPLSHFIDRQSPRAATRGVLPVRTAASVVRKLALALAHAHGEGVIHRDLKPDNIMIDRRKEPLIMDFGLARRTGAEEQTRLTQDGMILGTPAYMSPEQVRGELDVGPASDVYSLGVILFELLTAELPFAGNVTAVIGQILTKEPPAPSSLRPEVDTQLDAICQKMMAKQTADRFASMNHVAEALTGFLKGGASTASRTGQASGARVPAGSASDRSLALPAGNASGSPQTVSADDGLAAFLATASEEEFPVVPPRREGTLSQLGRPLSRLIRPWKDVPPRTKAIATSLLAGLMLVMSVVILLRTPTGTLRVEVVGDENEVQVLIDGSAVRLTDGQWSNERKAREHRLALRIGGQQLTFDAKTKQFAFADGAVSVKIAGVNLSGEKFEVLRDRETVLTIEVMRDWITLFDGKTLAGWETEAGEADQWNVVDGHIRGEHPVDAGRGRGRGRETLWTKGDYDDFELRFAYRGGNTSFFPSLILRGSPDSVVGYTVALGRGRLRGSVGSCGTVSAITPRIRGNRVIAKPDPQAAPQFRLESSPAWNRCAVRAEGNRLQVTINGVLLVEATDAKNEFRNGRIGFSLANRPGVLEFKDVELRRLGNGSSQTPQENDPATGGDDREATMRILELGGMLQFDDNGPSLRIASVEDIPAEPFRVTYVMFSSGRFGEELAVLQQLPELRRVYLNRPEITKAGFEQLAKLTKLDNLWLARTNTSDDDLPYIAKMQNLNHLDLRMTAVTDKGIQHLAPLKNLRTLRLPRAVTLEAVKQLQAGLPNCEIISSAADDNALLSKEVEDELDVERQEDADD